jgi:hypothetical protein
MRCRTGLMGRRLGILGLALAVAAVLAASAGVPAWAGPPAPTISESDLNTLLQSGTPVTGYFATVLGGATLASQTPVQIPVTVQGIVPAAGPAGDLILFQASGAQIDAADGIAEGMSGSPLYVDDSGVYKLAGAVSYGDVFTTRNLGLATPIGDMAALQSSYFGPLRVATTRLPQALGTAQGSVARVTVTPSRAAAAALPAVSDTAVMAPLACVQINGLIPGSPAYKKLAARFAALGLDVSPRTAGATPALPPLPALTAGSSLGVMYSDGDFAAGGLGTVTYVDPATHTVVAFGHALDYLGAVSLDLTSAWVQGIWSDSQASYKVMSPVTVVGQITQDRGAGVAGPLGAGPLEVPVTSSATLGGATRTAASTVTEAVVNNIEFEGLPSAAAAVAMQRATDTASFPGSADATVTIKVHDATGQYTIKRTDVWDDSFDVMSVATGDIDDALGVLTSGLPGLTPVVDSIDFSAALSAAHKTATIEDVTAAGGLKTGANQLTVSLLTAGGQTVTVPVTLQIPRGTATHGSVDVSAAAQGSDGGGLTPPLGTAATGAQTLSQVVDQIDAQPTNSDLDVVYTPDNAGAVVQPVDVLAPAPGLVVQGEVEKTTGELRLMAPATLPYDGPLPVAGLVREADADTTVRIYERPAGKSQKLAATVPATLANDGSALFQTVLPRLKTTTVVTVVWDGDADHLAGSAGATVAVRPRIALTTSLATAGGKPGVHFAVKLTPAQPAGTVSVERLTGKRWVRLAALPAAGPLGGTWQPAGGTYKLRARFSGSTKNGPATSHVVTDTVP